MNILDTIKKIRNEDKLNILYENCNSYRILIKEEDGVSAYYFSVPIYRESDKKLIKLNWDQENDKVTFQGVNANIQVKNNVLALKNCYGRVYITFYDDIEIEPTFNGVAVRVPLNRMAFNLVLENELPIRENEKYFAFMRDEFVPFLVVNGLYGRKEDIYSPLKITALKINDITYEITVEAYDSNVSQILFEIDLHLEKLVFDTTVESKNPDNNNAFGGIAFLGKTKEYGEQWLYSRFDTMQLIDLNGYLVKEANLYLPRFDNGINALESYKMTAPWCSFGSTWNTKTAFSDFLHIALQNKKYEIVEMTNIIKDVLRLNEPRNPGVLIKGNDANGFTVVSTGDNYLLPQILEIKLKNN